MPSSVLLEINDLSVTFTTLGQRVQAVRGLELSLLPGQFHALVGESGAGKTMTALSVMRLLDDHHGLSIKGKVLYKGHDLLTLSSDIMRNLRGREISMIFQEPSKYLNPSLKASRQVMESLRFHLGYSEKAALEKTRELFAQVGLNNDRRTMLMYPHEFSGGMRQRIMIAMAISCSPSLLIADEPTTALDVKVQRQIMNLLLDIKSEHGMAFLYITHDLGIVRRSADFVSIIYAGKIVETAAKTALMGTPLHPYTRLLLSSTPGLDKRGQRLKGVPGNSPDPARVPPGCSFHPRCPLVQPGCLENEPPLMRIAPGHRCACFYPGKDFEV
jgi:oligopeptide/dipeptide ABC transporter ATP-binding protein